jgi:hypothetical protein
MDILGKGSPTAAAAAMAVWRDCDPADPIGSDKNSEFMASMAFAHTINSAL